MVDPRTSATALGLLLASSCGEAPHATAPAPEAAASHRSPPSPPHDAFGRLTDPRHWALLSPQTTPAGHVDYHHPAPRFPIDDYDEVRLYHRGFDRWAATGNSVDAPLDCYGRAVTAEGTLCPSVVLPGRTVPLRVARELASRFNAPPLEPSRVAACVDDPHHAFVYYRRGVPVGEILIDVECPIWSAWPGHSATIERLDDRRWVRALLHDEAASAEAWFTAHLERAPPDGVYVGYRLRPRVPRVDLTQRVDSLSDRDRLALCVWNTQHVFDGAMPERWPEESPRAQLQWRGESLPRWSYAQNWPSCVETFPRDCDETLARILPCMDLAQRGDPWLASEAAAACRPLRACLWGFVTGRGEMPE